jgi:predicted RNase H-like nuclease (RuvC/YqgF family)
MTATQRQLNDVHDSWQTQTVELASNQSEIVQLQNEIERLTTSAQEVQQQSKNEVIVHKTYEQNEINHLKTSLQEV